MSTTTRLMTADELERMPDDGKLYELVKGALVSLAPTGHPHGETAAYLTFSLVQHVLAN